MKLLVFLPLFYFIGTSVTAYALMDEEVKALHWKMNPYADVETQPSPPHCAQPKNFSLPPTKDICSVNDEDPLSNARILSHEVFDAVEAKVQRQLDYRFFSSIDVLWAGKSKPDDIFSPINEQRMEEFESRKWDPRYDKLGTALCGMTKAQHLAVMRYVGPSDYRWWNWGLRGKPEEKLAVAVQEAELISALKKLASYSGIVQRGADLPAEMKADWKTGAVVSDRAFLSAARGTGFIKKDRFVILSKTGRYLGPLWDSEQEVIFLPNTKFKILKREENSAGYTEYVLEEL